MALVRALRGSFFCPVARHSVCCFHDNATRPPGSNPLSSSPSTSSKDKLTDEISRYVYHHRQSDSFFQHKYEAVMALEEVARRYRDEYAAFITGSSMNGVGTNTSDTDITLINRDNQAALSRSEVINFLENLKTYYEEAGNYGEINIIHGKVPLLTVRDMERDIPFDVTLDGSSAVRNTYMLQLYSACDYRVVPLIMVVKDWAKKRGIKAAHQGLLSSYGISLMVLHFLQVQQPWVVPSLHKTMKQHLYLDIMEMQNRREHDLPETPTSNNTTSLGELLCGFFRYYAAFQFEDYIIQVAEARALHSQETINPAFSSGSLKKSFVKIEEPFSKSNVSHSILKRGHFMRLRTEFVVADDALFYDSNPSLSCIGLDVPKAED
eukprot:scpid70811/ scgid22721/ Poly(A) RNA polymerase GLD2-A; PAP-associated domain-containing protein 4-A